MKKLKTLKDAFEGFLFHKKYGIIIAYMLQPNPRTRFFFVQDPDGVLIQIVEEHE